MFTFLSECLYNMVAQLPAVYMTHLVAERPGQRGPRRGATRHYNHSEDLTRKMDTFVHKSVFVPRLPLSADE